MMQRPHTCKYHICPAGTLGNHLLSVVLKVTSAHPSEIISDNVSPTPPDVGHRYHLQQMLLCVILYNIKQGMHLVSTAQQEPTG